MRKKRVELVENVVIAARNAILRDFDLLDIAPALAAMQELVAAVRALDEFEASEITGAGARWAEGSDTSKTSADLAATVAGSTRHEIIGELAHVAEHAKPGYTDEQLERRLGTSSRHQTVSSARNWLCEAGWVRDSGMRRKNRSGRPAVVWELTPAAWKKLKGGTL